MNGDCARDLAVESKRIWKSFGFYKYKTSVLKGADLNVPKGCIYGLLGSSGCGKTTLLKCVIGQIKVDNGHGFVKIFGHSRGSVGSNIPGSGVGYMPQELALCTELTTRETLAYFGRIHNMSENKIKERTEFLLELLNLPTERKLIKNLSGGQQRRASFAIALLHEPPLLILDEPTVGVDPILRQNIWEHLVEISRSGNTTTIITTHYIEEARKANFVGLMRDGKILAEDNPETLLNKFGLTTLEDVFLRLCYDDVEKEKDLIISYSQCKAKGDDDVRNSLLEIRAVILPEEKQLSKCNEDVKVVPKYRCLPPSMRRIRALGIKNYIKISRRLLALIFQFLVPVIQIALFCLTIGGTPRDLNIAVVNEDALMGRKFLTFIDNNIVHQLPIDDLNDAEKMIHEGEVWGLIHIWRNYTSSLRNRYVMKTGNITDDIKRGSTVHVRLDMTDQQIAFTLQESLFKSFKNFGETMMNTTGFNIELDPLPLEFGVPIYGTEHTSYFEYVLPGFLVLSLYFVAVGLTALDFVAEIKEGLLDRGYAAGVTAFEVMCSHIITEIVVMVAQVALVVFFLLVVFEITCRGSVCLVITIVTLQGLCGMTFGYLISAICQEQFATIIVAMGTIFPNFLLNGVVWPIEAMPGVLHCVSRGLPHTYAIQGLRSILLRGRGLDHFTVWRGILVTIGWIFGHFTLTAISLKIR